METLGIQATSQLGKYLGFPLKHKGTGRNQYNFIVDRIISKLAGWKSKLLSFVGKTVLVKSVMTAIPNYVMQGVALPSHLCSKIDKINRDFLWGSTEEKRRLHLAGWSKVIKSKEEGGLGIQAARAKNIAMLAKLNWRLFQEKDTLGESSFEQILLLAKTESKGSGWASMLTYLEGNQGWFPNF